MTAAFLAIAAEAAGFSLGMLTARFMGHGEWGVPRWVWPPIAIALLGVPLGMALGWW